MTTTATPIPERVEVLQKLHLGSGEHEPPPPDCEKPDGCLLEIASWLAGEPWSDHPECTSPILGSYGRSLNDRLGDKDRQKLLIYASRLIGTANDGKEDLRRWVASDYAVRKTLPFYLDLAEQTADAQALRDVPPIVDRDSYEHAYEVLGPIRDRIWERRQPVYDRLRQLVRAELEGYKVVVVDAAADAAATAAFDAVAAAAAAAADALAAAAAAAVAVDAVADAVAAASDSDAAAAVDAVAVAAAADAVTVAAAADAVAAYGRGYWAAYDAAKKVFREKFEPIVREYEAAGANNEAAFELLELLIEPERLTAAAG